MEAVFTLLSLLAVEKPRNVGSLDKDDPNVGTGVRAPVATQSEQTRLFALLQLVGAPACGDVMKLQLKVIPRARAMYIC